MWQSGIGEGQGPYSAVLKRGALVDQTRQNEDGSVREVPFKLYYPDGVDNGLEKFPLIVWSHGYGGSHDGAGFLARYITSYGYIVVHITHRFTDSSLWEGKGGHPWDILKDLTISRATTLNRYRDLSFVLDALPNWMQDNAPMKGYGTMDAMVDWTKIGMSGHSFGAITTQVAAGQLTPDADGNLISLHEPRLSAAIAYSPVPGTSHLSKEKGKSVETDEIYGAIATPMLHMTGTQDSSPVNDLPYQDRLKVHDNTKGPAKALLVKQGGDHMVYNGTRGALNANPMRERHEDMIKLVSLAWWDYWLKEDHDALDWLEGDAIKDYLAKDAQWSYAER